MIDRSSRAFTFVLGLIIILTAVNLVLGTIASLNIEQDPYGDPSSYPPKVVMDYPRGMETVNSTIEIKWRGSDRDGDAITYDVSYSSDGGKTWTIIAADLPKVRGTDWMSLLWDTTTVPDGSNYLIRVDAKDDSEYMYITSEITEGLFTIDNSEVESSVPVEIVEILPVEVELITWNIGMDQKIRFTLKTTLNGTEVPPVEILTVVKVLIDGDEVGIAQLEDNTSNSYFIYLRGTTSQNYDGEVIANDLYGVQHTVSTRFSFIHWRTYVSLIVIPLLLIIYAWKKFPRQK